MTAKTFFARVPSAANEILTTPRLIPWENLSGCLGTALKLRCKT